MKDFFYVPFLSIQGADYFLALQEVSVAIWSACWLPSCEIAGSRHISTFILPELESRAVNSTHHNAVLCGNKGKASLHLTSIFEVKL